MPKWIRFEEDWAFSKNRKTKAWRVVSETTNATLGLVMWGNRWRKYCFYPYHDTMFEEDCLRDIASFMEGKTKEHRELSRNA